MDCSEKNNRIGKKIKTRYKIIIIGIVLASIVFGTHQYLMYQCGTLPVFMETPRSPNLWNCLEILENQSDNSDTGNQFAPSIDEPIIYSFEECIAAGNFVMESYPRQCYTQDGNYFFERMRIEKSRL